MARRAGLQAEVLANLALVMLAATGVLATLLVVHSEGRLRGLLARALIAEARAGASVLEASFPGSVWWSVASDGVVTTRDERTAPIDPESLDLAHDARRRGAALLAASVPWEPIRFATPLDLAGNVAVARLPRDAWLWLRAPRPALLAVIAADVLIFTAFGATLLRRRVVLPLNRLASGARSVAEGAHGARVPVEGTRETAEVATAFNEMTEALEGRTDALEKAVLELRDANRDLRRARASLGRSERLAAVGSLAAGVAHEVGNPMGAILAFLELARRDPKLSEPSRQHLVRAAREGERVRVILRQLLDFSRPPRGAPTPLGLRAVAEEMVALVRAQRRYAGIEIEVREEEGAPAALADRSLLAQVLLNLLINAADASGGGEAPRIELTIRPAQRGGARSGERPSDVVAKRRPEAVECEVRDNGPGVPTELRERIFDPFFTTKPPGEGTGLGLANALRLVEELNGTLELAAARKNPGSGAVFVLRLPAAGGEGARPRVRGDQRA